MKNVIIIGAGPAGYTAAIYASRANLEPLIIEGEQPGGQLMITTDVENFPGYPNGISGPQMMAEFKEQAGRFGASFMSKQVNRVDFSRKPYVIYTSEEELHARAVIIATGASARTLGLESEKEMMGYGVSACATCDGFFYKGKDVLLFGGGDSAMEEALFLTRFCKSVRIVHRREGFRASNIMLERARANEKIDWILNYQLKEVLGNRETGVTGAKLIHSKTGEIKTTQCAGIFIAIGHKPNTDIFKGILDIDEKGYLVTEPGSTKTNIPGVFACGDVQDSVFRQAITAAGTGCMAAIEAERWLAEN
ncbi:thioredoxin-disulfide reductase [Candidatus Riflebacteria bacterium]